MRVDARVDLIDGGHVEARDVLLDIPGETVTPERLAEMIVSAMNLLCAGPVTIRRMEIVPRGGHDDAPRPAAGLATPEAVRRHYGEVRTLAAAKCIDRLDAWARRFIALSPFCVVASADARGRCDATPRGDAPGSPPGDFIGTAWLSIYSKTKYVDECAAFISWFVNDPEPAKIFMAEHGPPGSKKIVEMLKPMLPKPVQKGFDFISYISAGVAAAGERPTQGAEVLKALGRIYQELAFGRVSLKQAVDSFFDEAQRESYRKLGEAIGLRVFDLWPGFVSVARAWAAAS